MITPRDMIVSMVTALLVMMGVGLAESGGDPIMHSSVFNWADLKVTPVKAGEVRPVFNTPTATMANVECHISTINPGESPHPPHRHPEEELLLLKEGTLEVVQGDKTIAVQAGGVIFEGSNELHSLRNSGTTPATYFVVKFTPHDLVKAK